MVSDHALLETLVLTFSNATYLHTTYISTPASGLLAHIYDKYDHIYDIFDHIYDKFDHIYDKFDHIYHKFDFFRKHPT